MTIKDIEKVQREIDAKKKEKIQKERDVENIETEWKKQGINTIDEAKAKQESLNAEIKKAESREKKLLNRLETEFKWEGLQ